MQGLLHLPTTLHVLYQRTGPQTSFFNSFPDWK